MTDARAADIQDTLERWRACGADRIDPVRFHFIEALASRAQHHAGETRRLLDSRLADLVEQYARVLPAASATADADLPEPAPKPAAQSPVTASSLGELLAHLTAHPALAPGDSVADSRAQLRQTYPELDLLDYFQATWARLSTNIQLRQSQEQVHENAGPLNSNHLVHRALSLMRDQSPGYLHQFLAYLDALSWVDQLSNNGGLAIKPATRAKKTGRATR